MVPEPDEPRLLAATEEMDALERKHTLVPGRERAAAGAAAVTAAMAEASRAFAADRNARYGSYEGRFGPAQ